MTEQNKKTSLQDLPTQTITMTASAPIPPETSITYGFSPSGTISIAENELVHFVPDSGLLTYINDPSYVVRFKWHYIDSEKSPELIQLTRENITTLNLLFPTETGDNNYALSVHKHTEFVEGNPRWTAGDIIVRPLI